MRPLPYPSQRMSFDELLADFQATADRWMPPGSQEELAYKHQLANGGAAKGPPKKTAKK